MTADPSPWLASDAADRFTRDHTTALDRARRKLLAVRARVVLLEDGHTECDAATGLPTTITGFYLLGASRTVVVTARLRPDYASQDEYAALLAARTAQHTALTNAYRRTLTAAGWTVTQRPSQATGAPMLFAVPPADTDPRTTTT